mgnify:CR=1 FL=1
MTNTIRLTMNMLVGTFFPYVLFQILFLEFFYYSFIQ